MKRRLTSKEIESITSFLTLNEYIPKPIAQAHYNNTKESIVSQLQKIEIYPELIPNLAEQIEQYYYDTQIQAGECVGVLTAQCIGEKQTQSNLNTFHKAGSSDKQPVVSKFAELLNATSKPKVPTFLIHFNTGNTSVQELRETMGHDIVQITVEQITKEIVVSLNKEPESWYPAYFILQGTDYEEWKQNWQDCLIIKIDMDLLFEYKLKLSQIAEKINSAYSDMFCIHSPDCIGQLHIYVDTDVDLEKHKISYITEENKRQVYLEEVVYPSIESFVISGISGILERFFVQDSKTWYIETQNVKDKTVKKRFKVKDKQIDSVKRYKTVLSCPKVDMKKTISNNVWDILHTLGIEAVRAYMIQAFSQIMDGINICHIAILVDKMTFGGSISSISRYGMRKDDSGVLGRASFEETLDNLLNAGAFCQEDAINSVSASIICGKIPQLGTGLCDLTVNLEKLGVIDEEDEEKEEVEVSSS